MAARVFVSHGGTLGEPEIAPIPYIGTGNLVHILFPNPTGPRPGPGLSALRSVIEEWWRRCFIGRWTHAFFTIVRTGCFVAEVVPRPRYELLTINSECKAMVVCQARWSLLSSGELLIGWGKTDKRKRWEAMFRRHRSLAAAQRGMPRIGGSLLNKISGLGVGGGETRYLNLMEFGEKWRKGCSGRTVEGGVMEVARMALDWGVAAVHSMACKLSGLCAPLGVTTTKFVPAMLSVEAGRQHGTLTEPSAPYTAQDEIVVKGGLHLNPKIGYYSEVEGREVTVLDFTSMHATIAIAMDICPTGRSLVPHLLSRLLAIKSECELEDTPAAQVMRAFVKFQMVATTGWLGRKLANGGTIARRKCYARILAVTRNILQDVVEHCEYLATTEGFAGMEVVYGVTDSLFLMLPKRKSTTIAALLHNLHSTLIHPRYGAPIRLTHERTFATLLLLKRNQYCGYTDKSKFYHAGIRRRTDHDVAITLTDLVYRSLIAPSPDMAAAALNELRTQLEKRNQWRTHARGVAEGVAHACKGAATPLAMASVMQVIDATPTPIGPAKRSLDCY